MLRNTGDPIPCGKCRGIGYLIRRNCQTCEGEGRVKVVKTLSVSIPPGTKPNEELVYPGEGNVGKFNGPAGDLRVIVGHTYT